MFKEKIGKTIKIEDEKIYVSIKKSEISNIVKTLVLNDIDVESANECENTLENMFFDMTKEDKKDE